jgi:hypothetical protein
LSVDQLSVDQLSVDQLSVDQLSVDQLSVDQLSVLWKLINCLSINCLSINCWLINCLSINCRSINCGGTIAYWVNFIRQHYYVIPWKLTKVHTGGILCSVPEANAMPMQFMPIPFFIEKFRTLWTEICSSKIDPFNFRTLKVQNLKVQNSKLLSRHQPITVYVHCRCLCLCLNSCFNLMYVVCLLVEVLSARVTRCVCEKITQKVGGPID